MNTRKHTIRSAFLIFLCMMLMMCITVCGEKTIKEYPNVALKLNIADVQGVNVKESADKEFINSVEQGYATGLKDVGKYIGNNVEGYLYQYKEGGFLDKCNSYGAYLVKKIDGGYLVIKVMTSDVNNTAMIDYVLSYFQDELGELKFEKV